MADRYEVCEVIRSRTGARVVRVLATASSRNGAHETARRIAGERGAELGPIQVLDTATRLWVADHELVS
jgi:hypothetical protein